MSGRAIAVATDTVPRPVSVLSAVPGRTRVRVRGLRGHPLLARHLERRLLADDAVQRVTANPVTGRMLVTFDARRRGARTLVALIAREAAAAVVNNGTGARAEHGEWHTVAADAALTRLRTSASEGLSTLEVSGRLTIAGPNRLPAHQPKSGLTILAGHLTSLPVLLLGGAVVLSVVTGALVDAGVILAVVMANAVVGYVTESRVERVLAALQNSGVPRVLVRRDGADVMVSAAGIVPGDILVLRVGHEVPADARVVQARGLAIDEAALTGESVAVVKSAASLCRVDAPLAARVNMVHAGTVVAEGDGLAVVTATGHDTELGRLRALVAATVAPPTPMERDLDRVGRRLVGVSLAFCGATLVLGLLRGNPALEMIRTVVSLAVAAVPEGLPAVATTTLALGMQRLMRQRALVRRLAAVDSLGAVTVICADKTGTLTENRMTVHAWYLPGHEYHHTAIDGAAARDPDLARAIRVAVLCNEAELGAGGVQGSGTEAALLTAGFAAGIDPDSLRDRQPLLALRPRGDGENWMAMVRGRADHGVVYVKGAPEEVLVRATEIVVQGERRTLTPELRREITAASDTAARRGLRMLGLAVQELNGGPPDYERLTWVGLVGLRDPVRSGVRDAMAACRRAGIRTIILTGDHAATAAAVHRELRLADADAARVMDAAELGRLDGAALAARVHEVDVFARVSPADKYRIVRALQESGEVVAMTGDGVNDAAALRAADIGVAMGARGTDLARDVADIVLLDDDFTVLVEAIAQGRTLRANIGRSLRFLLSTNFSELLVTLGGLAVGVRHPMTAVQFLWINLLSDVAPALALAVEPADPDVMSHPPAARGASLLPRRVLGEITKDATLLTAVALGAQGLAAARYGSGARATTVAFSTLTAGQLVHALRYRTGGAGRSMVPMVVAGTVAAQVAAMTLPPLRRLLGLTPLSLGDWAIAAAGAAIPALRMSARTSPA